MVYFQCIEIFNQCGLASTSRPHQYGRYPLFDAELQAVVVSDNICSLDDDLVDLYGSRIILVQHVVPPEPLIAELLLIDAEEIIEEGLFLREGDILFLLG